ncbi:DUF1688-domain-containing protein [Dothidotthia symphoricarpi CBS 119687]|uniref:DUF1688-domain-containing protein n=1 Tax=Dothidotthia symphoricarpi CBS 119687 TaxID=1392245 RepID=A0A6A6A2F4_9PLEO|nr:DUF1688-domain-containing protein [Dothidotthia symphoricarpi CBS 119687]KAF2125363.1 DUF1688-domain-containing protein [Dothidotthia symphoricarpi CBS 119687]
MRLFGRKSSKPSISPGASQPNSSNGSLRSPGPASTNGSRPTSFPDVPLPKAPDPTLDPAGYLRSIYAVRERTRLVLEKAKKNQLKHFTVDLSKFGDVTSFVCAIIKRDYDSDYASIPPHGRWQHFDVGGRPRIDQLMASWPSTVDNMERTRRLLDLFLVSVLLDAGAGTKWQYKSKETGRIYRRSEGLAVASLEMFKAGAFSSNANEPCQVDSAGLRRLDVGVIARGLQVTDANPIAGLEGRTSLLQKLAGALQNQEVFGLEARPGNMIDYLLSHPTTQASSVPIIPLPTLWNMLMDSLTPIWPATRTQIDGLPMGDAWPCSVMPSHPTHPWENIVPFHKLTQWLTYSLMVPMTKLLNIRFAGAELLTGLPEYRNGGLFIDTGVLILKPEDHKRGIAQFQRNAQLKGQPSMEVVPTFTADDDVIVEWRAVTVGLLDDLLVEVNSMLGLSGPQKLNLAQMLEAGSWKGGREVAEVSRPNTKEPPIMIMSDGTVF